VNERDAFLRGARLFDAGAFFEAHEAWEEQWLVETDPARKKLFQGLIQVAAGFHKLRARADGASAARLLAKGLAKLESSPAEVGWIGRGPFCDRIRAWRDALGEGKGAEEPSAIPKLTE